MKRTFHIINWLLAVSLFMAFNYFPVVGGIMIVLEAVLLLTKRDLRIPKHLIPACLMAIALVGGMLIHRYSIRMVFAVVACLSTLYLLISDIRESKKRRHKVISIIGYVGLGFSAICACLLLYNVLNPDALMIMGCQGGDTSYPVNVQETHETVDDIEVFQDVTYTSAYPNNTYTVYHVPENKGVFFYIHGGGLVGGDKHNAVQDKYLFSMMDAGYSVVTVDYVLAPQNPFPQSVHEVNDALAYFIRHCDAYGLSADRIVVGGDSAGGMLSGLLAAVNTNPDYAAEMGIVPAVSDTGVTLKGYISIAGLVDVPRFGNTGNFAVDWFFDAMGRSAFQNADYACSDDAHLGSVLEHVTADFPPSYLSDGNLGTFTDQGMDLAARLNELGVPVETNFLDRSHGVLFHTWELDTASEQGAENFVKTIAFLDSLPASTSEDAKG